MRSRAWSITISVWTQTSPSGCHSGSCGQPTSALQLGQERVDDAEVQRERETDARAAAPQQQLLDLAPDPFGRQIVERNVDGSSARVSSSRQLESRGELHGAQHAQAVVAEASRIDDAQPPRLQVGAAVERVDVFAGQRIPARWR